LELDGVSSGTAYARFLVSMTVPGRDRASSATDLT